MVATAAAAMAAADGTAADGDSVAADGDDEADGAARTKADGGTQDDADAA
jgi:hypothetical protein